MPKLTDTQLVVLSAAIQRPRNRVLPLPGRIRGGAAAKVVQGLVKRGLVEEAVAGPDEPVWREAEDGQRMTLVATDAALFELGVESDSAPEPATGPQAAGAATGTAKSGNGAPAATRAHMPRPGTKQARLVEMLWSSDGATITEIAAATGWQPHTVRGAIAGGLKKRLGLDVTSEKVEGRGRVYRITG